MWHFDSQELNKMVKSFTGYLMMNSFPILLPSFDLICLSPYNHWCFNAIVEFLSKRVVSMWLSMLNKDCWTGVHKQPLATLSSSIFFLLLHHFRHPSSMPQLTIGAMQSFVGPHLHVLAYTLPWRRQKSYVKVIFVANWCWILKKISNLSTAANVWGYHQVLMFHLTPFPCTS